MPRDAGSRPDADALSLPRRTDPAVAEIARAWRSLTSGKSRRGGRRLGPGEPLLVACSGGADSSALAIALRAVTDRFVLAHIVHDMRPPSESLTDRDAVRELARRLGVPFVEAAVTVHTAAQSTPPPSPFPAPIVGARADRNIEQIARRNRYAALHRLAVENHLEFVATAHHAQDQLETLLMRLIRGTGPLGLQGIAERRPISSSPSPAERVTLIRPMLRVSRADAERLCAAAGWTWRDDITNRDVRRTRSALRARVVPLLLELAPGADLRAAQSATLAAEASHLIRHAARDLARRASSPLERAPGSLASRSETHTHDPRALTWNRDALRRADPLVLGVMLRHSLTRALAPDAPGADRLTFAHVRRIVDAIRSDSNDPIRFDLRGIQVHVTAQSVHCLTTPPPATPTSPSPTP